MSTMTLEPCPFCGSEKIATVPVANIGHAISCDECGASSEVGPTVEQAAGKWNQRAHLAQPAQAVDVGAIREVIDELREWEKLNYCEGAADKLHRALSGEKAGAVDKYALVGTLDIARWRGIDSMINTDFDYAGDLPDGTYPVYVASPTADKE